jgi:hypothetical protein
MTIDFSLIKKITNYKLAIEIETVLTVIGPFVPFVSSCLTRRTEVHTDL